MVIILYMLYLVISDIFTLPDVLYEDLGSQFGRSLFKFTFLFCSVYLPGSVVVIYSFYYIRKILRHRRRRSFPRFEVITILVLGETIFVYWIADYM
jgi:hypothetical protein